MKNKNGTKKLLGFSLFVVLSLMLQFSAFAQSKNISGTVTDKDGSPMPGVSVVIKGTTIGTATNVDGNFILNDVSQDASLVFTFIGMRSEEVKVGNETSIDIVMTTDAIGIEEIVTIGYGTQKKVNVTGSVADVKAEELTSVPVANITNNLAGRLPGLIVDQNSGRPGADGASLSIRGFGANGTSGQQGESPLVIVDGFQRDFSQLDPNEIESVTILKDASAAVYGVKAAAGVILVTTKRGTSGKPTITYNGNFSLTQVTKYPEISDYLDYKKIWSQHADGEQPSRVTPENGWITTERYEALENGTDPGTDWWDVATKPNAPMQNHNLNLRGGNDAMKYFVSVGYLDQGTIWETNDEGYKRYNTSVNLDAKITEDLSASFTLGWRREERETVQAGGGDIFTIGFAHPAFPSSIPDGRLPVVNTENPWSPIVSTSRENGGYEDINLDVLNGSLGLDYKIPGVQGLVLNGKVGLYKTTDLRKRLAKSYTLYAYNDQGFTAGQSHLGGNHALRERTAVFNRLTTQLSANYSREFGDHSLSALLLYETMSEESENYYAQASSILSPSVPYLSTADPSTVTVGSGGAEYGRTGLVGRVNYSYSSKYQLELSFRRDQSAYFPENSRVGFFPGVSAGWVISNENFFKNVNVINRFKIRASAARLGNDQANQYDFVEGYAILPINNGSNGYVWEGSYYSAINSLGTPNYNISWQQADLYNVGLEMSFLDNKLGFEGDAFYRRRFDLLKVDSENVNLPGTVGSEEPLKNIESRTNRGFEAAINYRDQFGDVKLSLNGNVAWAREKYDYYLEPEDYGDPDLERINRRSGQWVNRTFGYKFDGFFADQTEIDALEGVLDYFNGQNSQLKPGDIKLQDVNGDAVIDERDRVVIGRGGMPELTFGFNTQLEWKGFDFTMFWQGASNFYQSITGEERGLVVAVNGSRTPFKYVADRIWTEENRGEGADFPVDLTGPTNNIGSIDYYNLDSKYIRLKNLVIGYTLPANVSQKIGASLIRVNLSGTNLLTFDKLGFYGLDPESGGRTSYPAQKVYTLGVNISF